MNKLTKILLALLAVSAVASIVVSPVAAAEAATKSAPRTETVCTTGSYGQTDCHQVVTEIPIHVVEDTALPHINLLIVGLVAVLTASTFGYIKTKQNS